MRRGADIAGALVVDKPGGMSSFDVLRRLRPILGTRKLGHTGTLDPMATGVLVVCVGWCTRLARFVGDDDKSYEGVIRLGERTDTDDADGAVVATGDASTVTDEALAAAMSALRGDIEQTPPAYSAVKVDGRRAYANARAGREVVLAARPVTVHRFTRVGRVGDDVEFEADVSKGTYVRSLARDIGEALGCGAHLARLRRTRVGRFDLGSATTLDDLADLDHPRAALLDGERLVDFLPPMDLDERLASDMWAGRRPELPEGSPRGLVRLRDPSERFIGVGEVVDGDGPGPLLRVVRLMPGPGPRCG